MVELFYDIWCDVLSVVWCFSEVLVHWKQQVVSEHSFDDVVRRAHDIIILVAKLDL